MREVSSPIYQNVKVEGPSFPTGRASQIMIDCYLITIRMFARSLVPKVESVEGHCLASELNHHHHDKVQHQSIQHQSIQNSSPSQNMCFMWFYSHTQNNVNLLLVDSLGTSNPFCARNSAMLASLAHNPPPFPKDFSRRWSVSYVHRESSSAKSTCTLEKQIVTTNSTLPETNIAPENGWLEYDCFLLGWPIFRDFCC